MLGEKMHKGLHNLYSLPSIILVIKSRGMRWAGHVAHMGVKKICIYNFGDKT
jgi:hypothetical protein